MKKILSLLLSIALFTSLLTSPLTVHAENIIAGTLTHEHIGSEGPITNGCYTLQEKYGGSCPGCREVEWFCVDCGGTVWGNLGACRTSSCVSYGQTNRNASRDKGTTYHTSSSSCGSWQWEIRYKLGCNLTSCDYTIDKQKVSNGTKYTLTPGASSFIADCIWEYYEEGENAPIYTTTGYLCEISSDYNNGTLYVKITDASGIVHTLDPIKVKNVTFVFFDGSRFINIKQVFFLNQEIRKIFLNNDLVWSNVKEPIYWVKDKQFVGNGFPGSLTLSGSAGGTTTKPETDANSTTESNGATNATSAIVETQGYKYLTVVFESVPTSGPNKDYVDPGRFMVYSENNEELFYVATSGTYTVDISQADKIYIKLFAGAWAWGNNHRATIVSLHFHDE